MDHQQIDQFNLIDRYLMGKLTEEELSSFEEHFIDCSRCIAQLQTTKNFLQDLRSVNEEQALQANVYRPKGWFPYVSQRLLSKPVAWAALGICVVAIIGAFFALHQARRLQAEVNQANSISAERERRYEEERQAASAADQQHQENEAALTERLRQLETQIQDQQKQRTDKKATSSEGIQPGISLPIFILRSLRSSDPNASESINKIAVSRTTVIFAISISLGGEKKYRDYRIKVFDNHKQMILEKRGFQPDDSYLSIGFNSSFFKSGDYLLMVDGVNSDGDWTPVGAYPFRIVKNP